MSGNIKTDVEIEVSALVHVVTQVLKVQDAGNFMLVLRELGVETVDELVYLEGNTTWDNTIEYVDMENMPAKYVFNNIMKKKLLLIIDWIIEYYPGTSYTLWFQLTARELHSFKLQQLRNSNDSAAQNLTQAAGRVTTSSLDVSVFRKALKISIGDYKVLKKEDGWCIWERNTRATAQLHGVQNVLDSSYQPVTLEEKSLFAEHQKFMYSVFENCLQFR